MSQPNPANIKRHAMISAQSLIASLNSFQFRQTKAVGTIMKKAKNRPALK